MAAVLEKFRIPIGSLVVDGALVLTLVFTAGQMTSRFELMDKRLAYIESTASTEKLAQRTAVLEQRANQSEATLGRIEGKIDRIDQKLDGKADKALH